MKRLLLLAVGLTSALALSSCGGGGGGGNLCSPYAGAYRWSDGSGTLFIGCDGTITSVRYMSDWGIVHVSGKIQDDGHWWMSVQPPGCTYWGHTETRDHGLEGDVFRTGNAYWVLDGGSCAGPNVTLGGLVGQLNQR